MKLQELAAINPTKQAAKVFESYFGGRINIDTISRTQARNLLNRVRGLVSEHRRTPEFHRSEQNPSYLKLVMMEQVLSARVREDGGATVGFAQPSGGTAAKTDPQAVQGMQAGNVQQRQKNARDQAADLDKQIQALQQQKSQLLQQASNPMAESRRQRRLREASEIQQAQVVLASQDMVDQVQKMIEQVTSMQFKDLPALVDQIKNEVGADQAGQFNTDANSALGGGAYQGAWNATTNTPALSNATIEAAGHWYSVSAAGTVDFGAGNITFALNDRVYSNGTTYQKGVALNSTIVLPAGEILVGQTTGLAAGVTMSGQATISNAGVLSLAFGSRLTDAAFDGTIKGGGVQYFASNINIAIGNMVIGTPYILYNSDTSSHTLTITGAGAVVIGGDALTSSLVQTVNPGTCYTFTLQNATTVLIN